MSSPSWTDIEAAFNRVLDVPAAERAAAIDALGDSDPALRDQVRELIASDEVADAKLRTVIETGAAELLGDLTASRVGRHVGPYRLVELVGEGGMGAVYRAVRSDAEYARQVAVKILRPGLSSAATVARLRDERQILAALDHPGIVHLLDGGSTDDGAPYLVLEYVEGEPIHTYARRHALTVAARLELFVQVCAAVQYAHQHLVVHRDIKPSNVLVGDKGAPKLLDFGIAKLLVDGDRESVTHTGMALLTPEYASPEQARGQAVSTATDVYAMGALLYLLLADQPAHAATTNPLETLRAVCEDEPARPSMVAPPERRSQLAGDLDNIIAKAMQKEPAARYASVEQFAEDVRRHRAGLPVLARAPTLTYRAGKLLRRHGGKLAIAAATAAVLVASTVSSKRAAARADREAERAAHGYDEGRRLAHSLVFDIEPQIRSLKGATAPRKTILDSALRYLDGLAANAGDDPEVIREIALSYMRLGEVQGGWYGNNLGNITDSLASYRKALALLDRMPREAHAPETERARAIALIDQGLASEGAGDADAMVAMVRDGLARADQLPATARIPAEIEMRAWLTLTTHWSPSRMHDLDRLQAAADRWVAETPGPEARYWQAIAIEQRSTAEAAHDPARAIAMLHDAASRHEVLARDFPDDARFPRERAVTLCYAAGYYGGVGNGQLWLPDIGDRAGGIATLRSVLPEFETESAHDPADVRARVDLAAERASLALMLADDDPQAAADVFARTLAELDVLPPAQRDDYYTVQTEWFVQCGMAVPLAALGRRDDVLAHAARGQELAARVSLDLRGGETTTACRYLVARARLTLGDRDAASALLAQNVPELHAHVAQRGTAINSLIGLAATLDELAQLEPTRACELRRDAQTAWRAWPERGPFVDRRQTELDRAADSACTQGAGTAR